MITAEFVENIEDMEAYSNQAMYALDERRKINQFKIILRGEIEHSVAQLCYNTYVELLEQCYMGEHSLKKIKQEWEQES